MIDCPTIADMKTIKEIRRENAQALATEGPAEFARRIESTTQQVNQTIGPNPTRNIGNILARRIEAGFGLQVGWLDVEHLSSEVEAAKKGTKGTLIKDSPDSVRPKLPKNIEPGPEYRGTYPLISWVQAGTWEAIVDNFAPGDAEEWLDSPVKASSNSYYLRVRGESMFDVSDHRSFREGEIVLVDPEARAENGSFVIVRLDDDAEATFKQLIIEEGKKYLKALNPSWPNRIIQVNGNATICGVVKTKIVRY